MNNPASTPSNLTITRPDDWHLHVRDGAALASVVPHTAAQFGRAIIMPNLKPPVTSLAAANAYKARIMAAVPAGVAFEPLMTLYLTDNISPAAIIEAKAGGVLAAKLYPAGATTNSDMGVTSLKAIYPVLEAMQRCGMLLLVHGEVTSADIDLFDREAVFIEQQLIPLRRDFPELSTSPRQMRRSTCTVPTRSWRPPLLPTTCCTTATPFLPAAFAPITTACPCSNVRRTGWPCLKRPLVGQPSSF
jgi:hypothetical protein